MKKILLLICYIVLAASSNAQEVLDNFNIGPYEVDYKGKGDVNYRLKKDVDLYKFFDLKKDTVTITPETKKVVITKASEIGAFYALPRFGVNGSYDTFGIQGFLKRSLSEGVIFDFGLKAAISYGHYNSDYNNLKEVVLEVGVPLELEFAKLLENHSSLYVGIGIVPTFFSTLSCKDNTANIENHNTDSNIKNDNTDSDNKKKNGIYISPRVDFGGYIPFGSCFMKLGVFGEYKICCSKEEDNIFKDRIGRAFVGANIGWIF